MLFLKICYLTAFSLIISHLETVTGRQDYVVELPESSPKMQLRWNVDYADGVVNFILDISGPATLSTRIVGIGMSDRGQSTNADIVVMRYKIDGIELKDSWSDREGRILEDNQQNYHLADFSVERDRVSIAFSRDIDTHDKQDYVMDNGTTNLFYFTLVQDTTHRKYGFSNVEEFLKQAADTVLNASNVESKMISLQLIKPDVPPSYFGNEQHVSFFSVLQPNVTLPPQVTTYWCSTGKLPDFIESKIHAVGFGANVTRSNRDIVHHMEVFLCDPEDGEVSQYTGICDGVNEPDDVKRCNRVVGAWAKGAQDVFYPEEAGIPFGGYGESRYFRLEIHYHNPNILVDIVDSSGMNFYYTDKLRRYDAGVLEVGISYNENLAIPPKNEDFVLKGICTSECTQEGLAPEGINVFASQLHTHLMGRKVWISHLRGQKHLPELNRDNHYQSTFQEIRQIYPPVRVLPGDSLVTACSYDSTKRSNVTTTGDSLFQEMCVSYLHYYPLSSVEVCKSSISTPTLGEFFLLQKLFTGQPQTVNFNNLASNYNRLKWKPELVRELEMTYESAPQDVECRRHNGDKILGNRAMQNSFE